MSSDIAISPRDRATAMVRRAAISFKWLAAGTGIGILALLMLAVVIATAVLCLAGVGLLLVEPVVLGIRAVADLERIRLRAMGYSVISPYDEAPRTLRAAAADLATRRDLAWLAAHGSAGTFLGLFGLQMPVNAVREVVLPMFWQLLPDGEADALNGLWHIGSWTDAFLAAATGPIWLALWLGFCPTLMVVQAKLGRRLLNPHPDVDLSARIAQLTSTRAAALDAHAVELRRIERALHDGAQNRLVGVAMLTGAARQALTKDPERVDAILERVQLSAEDALAELRSVVRSILPPVLENRGLEGAMLALASECAVPCDASVDVPVRCPASVEATAYFVVAEALTNVSKHSGADAAAVEVLRMGDRLRITVRDNGRGGADAAGGTGIAGIDRRVAALDGQTRVTSPPNGPTVVEVELPCGL